MSEYCNSTSWKFSVLENACERLIRFEMKSRFANLAMGGTTRELDLVITNRPRVI